MKITVKKLKATLKAGIAPVYLVSGDEPYQCRETVAAITQAAVDAGFSQTVKLYVESGFDWSELESESSSLSLFGDKKLIDLKLPTAKPGKDGGAVIKQLVESSNPDTVLVIHSGKLDGSSKNSAWYKAIDKFGVHVEIWPFNHRDTERWIRKKLQQAGFQASYDAVRLLMSRVEGNMLAAVQEIEKISLICDSGELNEKMVMDAVSDSARYDLYEFADSVMRGDKNRVVLVLAGLREEGINENQVLWVLSDRIFKLTMYLEALASGSDLKPVFARLWKNQINLTKSAGNRLSMEDAYALLNQAYRLDAMAKGRIEGNVWDELLQLCLNFAGSKPLKLSDLVMEQREL